MGGVLDLSNNSFDGNLLDNLINEMSSMMLDDDFSTDYDYLDGGDFGSKTIYVIVREYKTSPAVMINLRGVEKEMIKIYIQFALFNLSSNHFLGEILKKHRIMGLNLSHNVFTGTIPQSIGNLTKFELLVLSSNNLVGGIPKGLVKLTSLGALDIFLNNLTGPIPSEGHFNTFLTSLFEGNPVLCGIPLTKACSQGRAEVKLPSAQRVDEEDEAGWWLEWKFVAMGFGERSGERDISGIHSTRNEKC